MPALKHSYIYEEEEQIQKVKRTSSPIKQEQRSIKVNIESKKSLSSKMLKVNFALLSLTCLLTLVFTVVYSIVAINETQIANLHTKISELNYVNVELENKLENVKSYYAVDNKVANTTSFDKAKNVIEVNQRDAKPVVHNKPQNNNLNSVTGF